MQTPCSNSRSWRLRFTVTDQPGCLAAAAAALAELGVNILSLDVHVVSATEVIDEATVSVPAWLDLPAVEYALISTGATDVRAVPIPVRQLEDIATRALRIAAGVISAGAHDRVLSDAISQVVDAELVTITATDPGSLADGAACPGSDGLVRFGRQHVKRLPSHDGAWTMAVPDDHLDPGRIAVAARRSAPFTDTDAARVRALLQVCDAVSGHVPKSAAPGPEICIGRLDPSHLGQVEELHGRCSPSSRYSRYFSPMPTIRRDVIAPLLDAAHGRIAVGAWIGGRLVGVANGCPVRPDGTGLELAVLVEDAHQGHGIGTQLVRELVAVAAVRGTDEYVIVTFPQNLAMRRIVQRVGNGIRMDWEGDTVVLRFRNSAPANAPGH